MRRWLVKKPIQAEAVIGDYVGRALLENYSGRKRQSLF